LGKKANNTNSALKGQFNPKYHGTIVIKNLRSFHFSCKNNSVNIEKEAGNAAHYFNNIKIESEKSERPGNSNRA
jgi:hypothetical protein